MFNAWNKKNDNSWNRCLKMVIVSILNYSKFCDISYEYRSFANSYIFWRIINIPAITVIGITYVKQLLLLLLLFTLSKSVSLWPLLPNTIKHFVLNSNLVTAMTLYNTGGRVREIYADEETETHIEMDRQTEWQTERQRGRETGREREWGGEGTEKER